MVKQMIPVPSAVITATTARTAIMTAHAASSGNFFPLSCRPRKRGGLVLARLMIVVELPDEMSRWLPATSVAFSKAQNAVLEKNSRIRKKSFAILRSFTQACACVWEVYMATCLLFLFYFSVVSFCF